MRLSDGMIQETDCGLIIRLENANFASSTMISWSALFFLNGDNGTINDIITNKIEDCQQRLSLYVSAKYARGGSRWTRTDGEIILKT